MLKSTTFVVSCIAALGLLANQSEAEENVLERPKEVLRTAWSELKARIVTPNQSLIEEENLLLKNEYLGLEDDYFHLEDEYFSVKAKLHKAQAELRSLRDGIQAEGSSPIERDTQPRRLPSRDTLQEALLNSALQLEAEAHKLDLANSFDRATKVRRLAMRLRKAHRDFKVAAQGSPDASAGSEPVAVQELDGVEIDRGVEFERNFHPIPAGGRTEE